ncbi:MAG: 4-hydroxy-tetrahydrodipicolinate synthase [Cyclonatronaceae bacterium]
MTKPNHRPDNILWTALITPLDAFGRVSEKDLGCLLTEQEQAGNGILILGSTGEALNLTDTEKREIVEYTGSRKLTVPVMAGVGGHNMESALSWLAFLETQPLDAYLMVTPIYAKPGPNGQYHWFKTLMDRSSRPVMLYNVPGRSACALSIEAVERLNAHPAFWAIKEASGSQVQFSRYFKAAGKGLVYSGDDAMIPDFAPLGAAGLVSVASNAWPDETRLYTRMALDFQLRQLDIGMWRAVSDSLFTASNPVPVKSLLASMGRIGSPALKPPLHHSDMVCMQEILDASGNVNTWFQAHSAYFIRETENA